MLQLGRRERCGQRRTESVKTLGFAIFPKENGALMSFQAWMERKCCLIDYSSIAINRSGLERNRMASIGFTMESSTTMEPPTPCQAILSSVFLKTTRAISGC